MKTISSFTFPSTVRGILLTALSCVICSSLLAYAQDPGVAKAGNKTVFNASGVTTYSNAYIDASAFYTSSSTDICVIINNILTNTYFNYSTIYPNGGVIDARGIFPTGTTRTLTCSINPFLGAGGSGLVSVPSTVLLPSYTLNLGVTWTLPSDTKIVGEGRYTVLYPQFNSGDVIDMGTPAGNCGSTSFSGISVEHLKIGYPGPTSTSLMVNAIVNDCALEASYVNDVNLYEIGLAGILVGPGATDSGPYTNVNFTAGNGACDGVTTACPVCANIKAQTRGLHGFTCIGNNNNATNTSPTSAAIYVNSSYNTVEDVHVESFWDGIRVGDTNGHPSISDVAISNITGATSSGKVTNVVHICGPNYNSTFGACSLTNEPVSDVTVSAVDDVNNASGTVIEDDVAGTSVAANTTNGYFAGLYALGESIGGGHSRFATSPASSPAAAAGNSVVPWAAGNVGTTGLGTSNLKCYTPGALFSNTAGTSTNATVYICSAGSWTPLL